MKTLLWLALAPVTVFAASSDFEGCKDLEVTKSRDFKSANVGAELQKAKKRIEEICQKTLPKHLAAAAKDATACANGATGDVGPGLGGSMKQQVQSQVSGLQQRITTACQSMEDTMKQSAGSCRYRQNALTQLQAKIAAGQTPTANQTESQQKAAGLYGDAVKTYQGTANAAGGAKEKIYKQLPDQDQARGQYMRKGNESASTADPKTDRQIAQMKSLIATIAPKNKNVGACRKLAAQGGELDDLGSILKNNLWPNGKIAGRAMARIEAADHAKAQEYGTQQTAALKNAYPQADAKPVLKSAGQVQEASDVTGTDSLQKQTPAQLSAIQKAGEDAAMLQAKTADVCNQQGGCGSQDAVTAAIKEASQSTAEPVSPVRSPAAAAVDSTIVPGAGTNFGQVCVYDDGKVNKPGRYNQFGVCEPSN